MTLASRQTTAQQTILEYENKGSVAKFFAGKSNVTQAQSSLNATNTRLPQAKEDLKCQQKLVQEYNYQLERVLLLQEQIKAVIPSKTKSYWESVLVSQQEELASFQNSLPVLSGQRDTLLAELEGLDIQQKIAKEPFDVLSELGRQLRLSKEKLSNIKNDLASEHHNCAILLDMECALCSEFYEHTADTNQELFEELSHLLIAVNREIASINITDLQHEKEQAENELIEIFRQLNEIKQKMQELEKQAIMNAKVVGATLAKTYWSDTLRERTFDTVILDEASMASIPALWCASYLAESSIIIVGDFLQLPPIVMAEAPMAQKWLGKDIFYHSGMQERARDKNTYKPHVERIKQLIKLEYENLGFNEDPNLINAGTIHGFQGSEADIVIFDVVIDEPHWKANLFMQDKDINDDLRKMFNVAITRAKFKLYVVGNFAYCQKRAKNNALAELLDKLINKEHFAKVDAHASDVEAK